jgi:hypothetical protein
VARVVVTQNSDMAFGQFSIGFRGEVSTTAKHGVPEHGRAYHIRISLIFNRIAQARNGDRAEDLRVS